MIFLADTTAGNSGVVKLRVGVIDNISSGSPVGEGNLNNTTDKITRGNFNDVLPTNKSFVADSGRHGNKTSGKNELKIQLKSKNLDLKKNIKGKTFNYSKERLAALEKKLIGTKPKLKTSKEGNGNNPPLPGNPTEDYCFAGPFQTTPNTDASVVVEGNDNWCDSIIICNSNEYLPNIILNQVPNGYYGLDICADEVRPLEGVNTFWTDTLYTFELSLCNNDQRQKLWFNINDNHTLKINYSYAICESNLPILPSDENCLFIDDWNGISNTLNCDQLEAILHRNYWYGQHSTPCYFFRNIIYTHEMEHVNDYQLAIDLAKASFYDRLDSLVVDCSTFENSNVAKIYLKDFVENKFKDLKIMSRNNFIDIQKEGELTPGGYEQNVQERNSVRALINNQIDAVNNMYGCSIPYLFE